MSRLQTFLRHKALLILTLAAVALNALHWVYLLSNVLPQEQPVGLHYNIYFGIDLFGPWWYLYLLPSGGLLILLVNTALAVVLCTRERLTSMLLASTSVLFQFFLVLISHFAITQI